ncbi:MFS transporter [Planotetraspora sp. A-T 1434]|uniref:MFS transporter n=1 Tax=Planotetraspora sp. A-T 1434 TaxID=2979219 RepID=UPI0021BF22F6|nr:MFS transporter [Planotetraspora sp. A-T 1434]MCT9931056.1 MFS transporter [Planotetraspora sp. A-T 1434]
MSTLTVSPRTAHTRLALAVVVTCQLMIGLDGTIVTIALPRIQQEIGFSPTGLSWVMNGYLLAFGGLLLLGGRAGDILGRRRVFVAGVLVFTLGSLLGGLATAGWWLLAARAAQGVGAAIAGPSILALIATTFAEGAARNRAISVYSAVTGAGGSIGLILGGALTGTVSWRWTFFVNVPIGLVVVALAPRFIAEPDRHPGRFDLAGAVTATGGMVSLVYALITMADSGWRDAAPALVVAAALLALFVVVETRARQPIMPLHLLADRNRSAAYLVVLLLSAAMFGFFFFMTQFHQLVLRMDPVTAGFAFLPMTLTQFSVVRIVPRLLPRFGAKRIVVTGATVALTGMLWLTRVSADTSYFTGVFGPTLLLGLGGGLSFMPLNATILSGVAPRESGAASGLAQTMVWAGGALGSAALVSVFGMAMHGTAVAASGALVHGMAAAFAGGAVLAALALTAAVVAIRSAGTRPTGTGSAGTGADSTQPASTEPAGPESAGRGSGAVSTGS